MRGKRGFRTGLEFELAAEDVHQQLDHGIHRCQSVGEQQESNHNGIFIVEPECLVQGLVVHKGREKSEDVEHVELLSGQLGALCILYVIMKTGTYLSNSKELRSVAELPVTKLVA